MKETGKLGKRHMGAMSSMGEQLHAPGVISDLFAQGMRTGGVARVLRAVRKYLDMDVAFVSRFRQRDRVMEHVDAAEGSPIYAGQTIPLEEGYCLKVAMGVLPELIADTSRVPEAMAIPATQSIPIGSHLSVPIRLYSGDIYGTLCCFSHHSDMTLGERDLKMLRAFAEVLAADIDEISMGSQARSLKIDVIRRAMAGTALQIVYQPIYRLRTGALAGMECLSRFDPQSARSPSQWFELAEEVGMRQDLELAALRKALRTFDHFPEWVYFGLNASPQTVLSGALADTLAEADLNRIVLEITEHAIVADYAPLVEALAPLRARGLRLAIDDAGAGYASMRHIVNLQPDFIKLDLSLTRNVDKDPSRRALAKALVSFAEEIGSRIIAEGIETPAELDLLRRLGVETGQGYLLSQPVPLEVASQPSIMQCELPSDQAPLHLQ